MLCTPRYRFNLLQKIRRQGAWSLHFKGPDLPCGRREKLVSPRIVVKSSIAAVGPPQEWIVDPSSADEEKGLYRRGLEQDFHLREWGIQSLEGASRGKALSSWMVLLFSSSFGWGCFSPLSCSVVLLGFLLLPSPSRVELCWFLPLSPFCVVLLSPLLLWGGVVFSPLLSLGLFFLVSPFRVVLLSPLLPPLLGWCCFSVAVKRPASSPKGGEEEGSTSTRGRRPSSPTQKGGVGKEHHPTG